MATFSVFPQPDEIFEPLSVTQLNVLAAQVKSESPIPTVQSRFNYSWGLLKSNNDENVKLGISILTEMFKDVPSRRSEFLYFLALGSFKLKQYRESEKYINVLIAHSNKKDSETPREITQLRNKIDSELAKNSLIGFAIISGSMAAAAGALSYFLKRRK